MGNFYCIPNGCARVVWQPYVKASGGIRYRYPNDVDWTYVEGDDYSLETIPPDCTDVNYVRPIVFVALTIVNSHGDILVDTQSERWGNVGATFNGLSQSTYEITVSFTNADGSNGDQIIRVIDYVSYSPSYTFASSSVAKQEFYSNYWGRRFSAGDGSNAAQFHCTIETCTFTAYLDEQIVHEQTENDCPEVEILNGETGCKLSEEYQELIIEKLPFLQRVEVRNQDIEVNYFGALPLLYAYDIPDNYLIIYKALVTAPIELNQFVPSPGFINPWEKVATIKSDPDCPPPEYTVYCDCDCRSCPDGTCAIECGDHVCCNDINTGDVIESIPIDEYCKK